MCTHGTQDALLIIQAFNAWQNFFLIFLLLRAVLFHIKTKKRRVEAFSEVEKTKKGMHKNRWSLKTLNHLCRIFRALQEIHTQKRLSTSFFFGFVFVYLCAIFCSVTDDENQRKINFYKNLTYTTRRDTTKILWKYFILADEKRLGNACKRPANEINNIAHCCVEKGIFFFFDACVLWCKIEESVALTDSRNHFFISSK